MDGLVTVVRENPQQFLAIGYLVLVVVLALLVENGRYRRHHR
jgi:hypothetical protein